MLLFPLLLLILPFAQSQNDRCHDFHRHIRKVGGRYFDCLKLPTRWQMSQCLLQSNTLEKTMRCAGWGNDAALWFDISRNPYARDLDMVPSLDNYNRVAGRLKYPTWISQDDSLVRFTPRGLIVAAAEACVYASKCKPPFFNQVLACPHEDMNVFIGCLLFYNVQSQDIDNFEEFIRGHQFGPGDYILDIRDKDASNRMQWSEYHLICHRNLDPDDDGDDYCKNVEVKPRAVGDPTPSYSFHYTVSTTYPIDNGPTPDVTTPSMDPTQTPDKDEDEDDTGTAASDVVAGTTTLNRKEAAATTTGASKNDAAGHVVVNVGVLVMVSVFRILL